ncbi:MAG: DUF1328 domain-containing protein [Nitrospira sp.]|nr:DUF1328 domain-containing protein [Nitrospira sp.]
MFFVWAVILFLIASLAAAFGFTDIAPGASEVARIVFYLILALFLLLLVTGFIVVRKVTSFARGFGISVSWGRLLGIMKWVQLLRKRLGRFRR